MTPDRRHSRAKKNTVETPVSTNAHHTQFPATPLRRTMSVTRFGVSLLNVVATRERPASHHGTARPETKNSDVLLPARFPRKSAGTKHTASDTAMTIQSMVWSCMVVGGILSGRAGGVRDADPERGMRNPGCGMPVREVGPGPLGTLTDDAIQQRLRFGLDGVLD